MRGTGGAAARPVPWLNGPPPSMCEPPFDGSKLPWPPMAIVCAGCASVPAGPARLTARNVKFVPPCAHAGLAKALARVGRDARAMDPSPAFLKNSLRSTFISFHPFLLECRATVEADNVGGARGFVCAELSPEIATT